MEIGDRIKSRREFLGLSQEELAHKVGYKSRSSINKIEIDGRGLPQSKIVAFANALETTPAYLMGWEEDEELMTTLRKAAREAIAARAISEDENVLEALEKYMYGAPLVPKDAIPVPAQASLPVLGRVCAGNGILAQEEVLYYEPVDAKYATGEYFYLKVKGDSMAPQIAENDLVLVRTQTSVDSGDVAVVLVDDMEGMIKKVVYDETNIHLISFNPYYPEKHFSDADVLRVRVVGKVIESKRKW